MKLILSIIRRRSRTRIFETLRGAYLLRKRVCWVAAIFPPSSLITILHYNMHIYDSFSKPSLLIQSVVKCCVRILSFMFVCCLYCICFILVFKLVIWCLYVPSVTWTSYESTACSKTLFYWWSLWRFFGIIYIIVSNK